MSRKLTAPQYRALVRLRNTMSLGGHVHTRTIRSLQRAGLIGKYSLEITDAGNAVMDEYSQKSLVV